MAEDTGNKSENWMRNLLLGSLGLNVFLAGFLFANVLAPADHETRQTPVRVSLGGLPSDIPMELREELEDSFQTHSVVVEEIYMELAEARLTVRDILEMDEFDQIALENALQNIRELQVQIQVPMHQVLVDAAMGLDAETRLQLLTLGERFDGRGLWNPKKFDGARWRVEFDNGEIILDLAGLTERNDEEDED